MATEASKTPKPYSVGKPFDIAELRKKTATARQPSPRDVALEKAIREAAAAAESQVVPFYLTEKDKLPTVKLAARRIAERLELPVNVGSNLAYPNTVLLSRGVLSNRGRPKN
jgi:hypothetical protein